MSNTLVEHPEGGHIFAVVEGKATRNLTIPQGPVILRVGTKSKFGLEHIWHRHGLDLAEIGYAEKERIAHYVADILQPGSTVVSQVGASWERKRLLAIRGALGLAVLEEFSHGHFGPAYSVVTAYRAPRPRGQAVTRILARSATGY